MYLEGLKKTTNLTVRTTGVSNESQTEYPHLQIWNVTTWWLAMGAVFCEMVTFPFAVNLSSLVLGEYLLAADDLLFFLVR